MSRILSQPFTLPCGVVIKNRIGKAPMTEGLADCWDRPTPELCRLYERWAMGGTGLSVTGNVMIDHRFLERPGNVVIENEDNLDLLKDWQALAMTRSCGCRSVTRDDSRPVILPASHWRHPR